MKIMKIDLKVNLLEDTALFPYISSFPFRNVFPVFVIIETKLFWVDFFVIFSEFTIKYLLELFTVIFHFK